MTRSGWVLGILLCLLVGTASAAELRRQITMKDGRVLVGVVLERGDTYVVLADDAGAMFEL